MRAVPKAARALPWLARMLCGQTGGLLEMVLFHAERDPDGLAIEMGDVQMSWGSLAEASSRVARALAFAGVRRGQAVALLGTNSPFYVAAILGINRAGATAALVNHHLEGRPLAHALDTCGAKLALIEEKLRAAIEAVADVDALLPQRWSYGEGAEFEALMDRAAGSSFEPVKVSGDDDFVYIYTSGTTGMPKPCRVSHSRAAVAGASFGAVMFEFEPGDKLYCPLPLYHSSALLLGAGACIATGTPLVLRESFSASRFWSDVRRYRATAMLYIGELCRYLVMAEPSPDENGHAIRVAAGNGMRADTWESFQSRFGIETIREFYAATESPGFLVNLSGKVGSVGHVPFAGLGWLSIVRYDVDRDEHPRDANGFCIECGPDEPGELLVRIPKHLRLGALDYRGYRDPDDTEKKVITSAFREGDRFFRTGDLLRRDADGFYYFVDRIGDTYRCKGENVSTAEVADVLSRAARVREVTVVGVRVPGTEGQFGLAGLVTAGEFDPVEFHAAAKELPSYAQPRFVRILPTLEKTSTLKVQKSRLRREGVDPSRIHDRLYLWEPGGYTPMTEAMYEELIAGKRRI